jgi:hypothetical protein
MESELLQLLRENLRIETEEIQVYNDGHNGGLLYTTRTIIKLYFGDELISQTY